jgi:hypothetical protein
MLQTPIPTIQERFLSGFTWWDYVAHMKVNRKRVSQLFEEITLSPDDRQDFAAIVAKHGGQLYITALTEDWCGDAAVNLPLIARLAAEVPGVDLRLFRPSDNPHLANVYAQDGITSIPVISFFNSAWYQVGQWVERPAAAQRRIEAWNAEHPQVETLQRSNQPHDRRTYRALLKERLIEMMDWYREGLWQATLTELLSLLRA